jgi:rod shape-determining protein MreC
MNILLQARGASLKAFFLIALSIAMMVVDHRFHQLEVVRTNISLALTPLRYLVSLPATGGSWISDWMTSHSQLIEENEALRARGRILNARLQKLEILAEENARLRSLLGSARKISDDVIVAELLSVAQSPYRQLIEINKGSSDGVEIGHAVIDDYGVMGQVVHVNPQSATIILISDPEHAIPVQFVRSGTRSVAFGRGSTTQLELRYLPATADIQIDDELVTSGLGGRFPPDYPVARVTAINEDRVRGFVTVFAEPRARLDSSREVLVIRPRQ